MWQATGRVTTAAMTSWHQCKLFIEHAVNISHDTLHLLAGLIIWLILAVVSKRSLTNWQPLLGLFAVIIWNEAVDLWVEQWPDPGQQYGEGVKDILVTMAIPAIMFLIVRWRPQLFVPDARE